MLELREFLSLLHGVQDKGNGQYMARCPAHDDHKQSLSVKMGEKKIVCHCMAGCEYDDILKAMGLTWKDVYKMDENAPRTGKASGEKPASAHAAKPAAPAQPAQKKAVDLNMLRVGGEYNVRRKNPVSGKDEWVKEAILKCYEYTDEKGNPQLRVYRTSGKNFPTVHLDGGKWYWGDGDKKDLLYKLPRVLKAIEKNTPVLLVEGEKDVETLESMGYVATSNKGGAGKWSEKLSSYLTGAKVIVIPDNDEPGRKHGKIVCNALSGVAREVRLVTLRRTKTAQLPEKGDISDLVQLIGMDKAKEELERLIAFSPVLSRKVSDDDYAEYFDGIQGVSISNGCMYQVLKDGDVKRMSNFVALPLEQVAQDDGTPEMQYSLTVAGWSNTGRPLKRLSVPLKDFDKMDWCMTGWGLDANIAEGNGVRQKLRRVIQEAGSRCAVQKTVYTHTGWRKIDGKWCFLHGGGAIGMDGIETRLSYGYNEQYCLNGVRTDRLTEDMRMLGSMLRPYCQGVSLEIEKVVGTRIAAPLLGFIYLAPLKSLLAKRGHRPSFVPFLRGGSGTGKSTLAALMLNHFGYDFSFEAAMPANFENTAGSIGLKLFQLKDLPLIVDDYHPEMDARRASAMAGVAESISRMIGDGAMRSRLRSDATAMEDKPVRGLAIETGEDTPNVSPSSVSRMYVIDLEPGDVPIPMQGRTAPDYLARTESLNRLYRNARLGMLNESMVGYLEWWVERLNRDGEEKVLDELESDYQAAQQDALRMNASHARMPATVSMLECGITEMLKYMSSENGYLDPKDVPAIKERFMRGLLEGANRQNREMVDMKPTEIFLNTVKELLNSGKRLVEDLEKLSQVPPLGAIGYRDDRFYYFNAGETYAAVCESLQKQNTRYPIGKTQLLKQLVTENISLPSTDGKSNVRKLNLTKKGRGNVNLVWIPRYIIDGEDKPLLQEVKLEQNELPF